MQSFKGDMSFGKALLPVAIQPKLRECFWVSIRTLSDAYERCSVDMDCRTQTDPIIKKNFVNGERELGVYCVNGVQHSTVAPMHPLTHSLLQICVQCRTDDDCNKPPPGSHFLFMRTCNVTSARNLPMTGQNFTVRSLPSSSPPPAIGVNLTRVQMCVDNENQIGFSIPIAKVPTA